MIMVTPVRRLGDVARDVLLDEILGDKVDELRMSRDANIGAMLRLRRHFPRAALKLTDEQWVYLSEIYDGGMTAAEVAKLHNVNKSAVSRSVNRAKQTLRDYLQFCL